MSAPSNKPVDLDEAEGTPSFCTRVAFMDRYLDVPPTKAAPFVGHTVRIRSSVEQMRAVSSSRDGESSIVLAARRVRLSSFRAVRVVSRYDQSSGII